MWFKHNTAQFCDQESKQGREIGTLIHQAIHDYITEEQVKVETTEYATEVMTALKSFILFRKELPAYKLINSEIKMTSEKHKLNGTLDCLANLNGTLLIADWKTGKCKKKDEPEIYDEYLYQVSAYVYLYNEIKGTNINKAIILALAKDKIAYNIRIMEKKEIEDCFNEVFLPALRIYNYQHKKKEE